MASRLIKSVRRKGAKRMRFRFEIQLDVLRMRALTEPVHVVWNRGARTARSKPVEESGSGVVAFGQKLSLICTLWKSNNEFQAKPSKIYVVRSSDQRTLGRADLNLAQYAGMDEVSAVDLKLRKCSHDDQASISVVVHCRWLRSLDGDDDMASMASLSSLGLGDDIHSDDDDEGFDPRHQSDIRDEFDSQQAEHESGSSSGVESFTSMGPPKPRTPSRFRGMLSGRSNADPSEIRSLHEAQIRALTRKLRKTQNELRELSRVFSTQEVALVSVKVKLCDAVNSMNDVEQENNQLRTEVERLQHQVPNLFV